MKKYWLNIFLFLIVINAQAQTNQEIETFTRKIAFHLGIMEETANRSTFVTENMNYINEEYSGLSLVKFYTANIGKGTLVYFRFGKMPYDNYRKCLTSATIVFISNTSFSSYFQHISSSPAFSWQSNGKYMYKAYDSPLKELIDSYKYKIMYEIKQESEIVSANKTAYSLIVDIYFTN